MGKKVYVDCVLEWAKVFENNRDMGTNLQPGDMKTKMEEMQGQYLVNLILDAATKKKMIADGIPNKGMSAQLFKEDDDGRIIYKAKREHFNPKFTDRNTGEQGVVMGPPKILKVVDGKNVEWDFEEDGYIGNGSKATVKLDVWDGKKVTLDAIRITEQVKYEAPEGAF